MLNRSREEMHTELRRRVAKVHKEYFGKGPSDISIIFFNNVMIIRIKDFLSPFEKGVIKLHNGLTEVIKLRNEILDNNQFKNEVHDIIDNEVLFIKSIVDFDNEEYFLFIKCTNEIM